MQGGVDSQEVKVTVTGVSEAGLRSAPWELREGPSETGSGLARDERPLPLLPWLHGSRGPLELRGESRATPVRKG